MWCLCDVLCLFWRRRQQTADGRDSRDGRFEVAKVYVGVHRGHHWGGLISIYSACKKLVCIDTVLTHLKFSFYIRYVYNRKSVNNFKLVCRYLNITKSGLYFIKFYCFWIHLRQLYTRVFLYYNQFPWEFFFPPKMYYTLKSNCFLLQDGEKS